MSTSGTYAYYPKVEHPNSDLYQMNSQQPSFYFGGSQVPINLHLESHGSGFKTPHKFSFDKMLKLGDNRKFNGTTVDKHNRIHLPKFMYGIKKL